MTRRCPRCLADKPVSAFGRHFERSRKYSRYNSRCRECAAAECRRYYRENRATLLADKVVAHRKLRDWHNAYLRRWWAERRRQVLLKYCGGRLACACCGEIEEKFLTLDHINGDGAAQRRQFGDTKKIFTWLIKSNYPPGYRVLCMNCNWVRRHNQPCPHEANPVQHEVAWCL